MAERDSQISQEVSTLIDDASKGDMAASEKLLPLLYDELKKHARWRMAGERAGHTLQTTALVHEAYTRLVGDRSPKWENERHFFGAAAEAMRRILIERARRKQRLKRGGDQVRIDFDVANDLVGETDVAIQLLELNEALERLEAKDEESALVVKLRHFGGLSIEEVAAALGISKRQVSRIWNTARAWLKRELTRTV